MQDPIKDIGKDFAPYLSEMQHELEQRMTKLGGKDAMKYQSVFAKHRLTLCRRSRRIPPQIPMPTPMHSVRISHISSVCKIGSVDSAVLFL